MLKGRIIKGIGGLYDIETENGIYTCSLRGIFRKEKITPVTGDYVEVLVLDEDTKTGSVEKILERKNVLIRPKVANVDICIITFAVKKPQINIDILDRFLLLSQRQNLDVVICINKCDLTQESEIDEILRAYLSVYRYVKTSTYNNKGIDELREIIKDKTVVFAGPSGVGKSSLINELTNKNLLKTGNLSKKIERGKHTTRQVELLELEKGTYIVDSPGFTSVSIEDITVSELPYLFKEFVPYLGKCRFNDCTHISEPDCEIKNHVGKQINQERYNKYINFYNELKNIRR